MKKKERKANNLNYTHFSYPIVNDAHLDSLIDYKEVNFIFNFPTLDCKLRKSWKLRVLLSKKNDFSKNKLELKS